MAIINYFIPVMIGQKQQQSPNTIKKGRNKQTAASSPNSKGQVPDYKTMLCEMTRIMGQQKLLYIKSCRQKNLTHEEFFHQYPYCRSEDFTVNIDVLKEKGVFVKDGLGMHWVEEVKDIDGKQKLNGWGISILDDDMVFEGIYHDAQPCGKGYELYLNGNTYVGGFKEGNKSGEGTFYWFANQEVYKGEWLSGFPHGEGKHLSVGDLYVGEFCNGLKYGNGQEFFRNGDRYVGDYLNGVAEGYGEYFWADGSIYKGDFKHSVRHGFGIWSDKEQTEIYSGSYRMDKKEGFGVYEWVGKQIYQGEFREDFRDGYGKLLKIKEPKLFTKELNSQIIYQGMWQKGRQKRDLPIDKQAYQKLQNFLHITKPKQIKKKRIGHRNCVPHN